MAIMGYVVGRKICEILGLNSKMVNKIEIIISPNDVATVEVVMYPDEKEFDEIISILKKYEFIEKPENSKE